MKYFAMQKMINRYLKHLLRGRFLDIYSAGINLQLDFMLIAQEKA